MEGVYRPLKSGWETGDRDRDQALNLMFLAWMHWADPPHITGLAEDPDANRVWHAVFRHFGGEASMDAEFLFVASIMAGLFPWALGSDEVWEACAERMADRARLLRPEGFSAEAFEGRGHYGDYFVIHKNAGPI